MAVPSIRAVAAALLAAMLAMASGCATAPRDLGAAGADASYGAFAAKDLSTLKRFARIGGRPVYIVSDSSDPIPIVVSDDERFVRAALQLADVVRRMSGVKPEVLREFKGQSAVFPSAMYVGDVSAARKASLNGPDGGGESFRVVVRGSSVFFLGRADYAVYDWCERQLGARCYWDDPAGEDISVPRRRTIVADAVDYEDAPVYGMRDIGSSGRERWTLFAKTGDSAGMRPSVHVPSGWWRDRQLVEEHPDVFALSPDGARAATPMLCYGNPATLEMYKRRIDAHIAGVRDSGGIVDTARKTISVSPWDAPLACSCSHCRPLFDGRLGRRGHASPVVWGKFLKGLAKWAKTAHPDYTVSFLPYWNYCLPPAGLDLREEGNCRAQVCIMPGLAMMKNGISRALEERTIRRWAEVTGRKAAMWHYTCWPAEYTLAPHLFGDSTRRHLSEMSDVSDGAYVCAGTGARLALPNYVAMRCLWNPSLDVEAVYDGFAARMFGPAAPAMRRLIALQESGWSRQWQDDRLTDAHVYGISYPPSAVDRMKALLDEAYALAEGDAVSRRRVAAYAAPFDAFFADAARASVPPDPFVAALSERLPVPDGRLDEPCWSKAPARRLVAAYGDGTNSPWAATETMAVWNASGVTFGFRCEEPATDRMPQDVAQEEFSRQDCVAVLLDTTGTGNGPPRRIVVDAKGRVSAFADDMPWDAAGVRAAVRVEKGFWSAEVHVPASALPAAERRAFMRGWTMNLVRMRIGDSRLVKGIRLEGSRAECSRLNTRMTPRNLDPNAFVPLVAGR